MNAVTQTKAGSTYRLRLAKVVDLVDFFRRESEIQGSNNSFYLGRGPHTDDRGGDRGVAERPGDRGFSGCAAVAGSDGAHQFGKLEITRKLRLLERRIPAAEIVFRKSGRPFLSHFAAEQSVLHRRIHDDPD